MQLVALLRAEYRRRGYQEVSSPLIYKAALWKTSGHLEAYAENMFAVTPMHDENAHREKQLDNDANTPHRCNESSDAAYLAAEGYGLKPMNCPGHCLIFGHELRSARDLPLRLADFSALHRNEASGALGGLTRLRRFQQDDAHIFCRPDQVRCTLYAISGLINPPPALLSR